MTEIKEQDALTKIANFVCSNYFKSIITMIFFGTLSFAVLKSNACVEDRMTWGLISMIGFFMGYLK